MDSHTHMDSLTHTHRHVYRHIYSHSQTHTYTYTKYTLLIVNFFIYTREYVHDKNFGISNVFISYLANLIGYWSIKN